MYTGIKNQGCGLQCKITQHKNLFVKLLVKVVTNIINKYHQNILHIRACNTSLFSTLSSNWLNCSVTVLLQRTCMWLVRQLLF